MKKVRLSDIAEEMNVSVVTVHNALNGNKGVGEKLRRQILDKAKEMGYEEEKGKTPENHVQKKIGVLIAENYLDYDATYYSMLYQELEKTAREKKCATVVEVLKKEVEKRTYALPEIVQKKEVEGLIIIGEIDKKYIRKLNRKTELPIVFLDFYDNELAEDAVIADNFYSMYEMTEYLFSQGIEEIGFVGSVYATSSIMDRYCGFTKSMIEHHIRPRGEWIIEDRDQVGRVNFTLPRELPKGFVCNCDLVAAILIRKLKERGLRVPEDISVVGFDNYLDAEYGDLQITTFEVDKRAMTKAAVDKLLKRIKNPGKTRNLKIISGHMVKKNTVKTR